MLVEKWESGHNIPRFTRDNPPQGPRRFTTTLKYRARARAASSPTRITRRRGASSAPIWTSRSATCRTTTARRCSHGGTVQIQNYKPMWANMRARFVLDGPHVDLDRIEIDTDGAKTVARGSVELGKRWPEQSYDFESRVQFPRMGDIFFSDQNWNLTGDGDVDGKFHLFKGGHDLERHVQERRPRLEGLSVSRAGRRRCTGRRPRSTSGTPGAKFFGGDAQFTYSIKPLGRKNVRSTSRFEASYAERRPRRVHRFSELARPAVCGLDVRTQPPRMADRPVRRAPRRRIRHGGSAPGRADDDAAIGSGEGRPEPGRGTSGDPSRRCRFPRTCRSPRSSTYRFTADELELEPSYFATERTHVTFQGATAWGERVALRVSRDEPRLAGERPGPGRPHQGLRLVERRGRRDRRARGIRRRDDRAVPPRARRRHLQRRRICARGTRGGARRSGHIVYEDDYITVTRRHRAARRFGNSHRRPVFARGPASTTAATKSTRSSASRGAISTACATRFKSTSTRCRAGCPASSA